jgi:archaellum component FlaC
MAMTEYIISCSGCGRRYKGAHSNKKFKCSSCNNVFTFPDGPRAAGIGNVVCAHCWNECPGHAHPFPCPSCNQTISPQHSARSVAWAAGSSLTPSVPDLPLDALARPEANEKLKDLEAKLARIQSRVDELQGERDRAIAQINQKQMEVVQLRTEFQQYRSIAVQALEPLCDEFSQRSKKMLDRLDLMAAQAQALREEFVVRIEKLETDIDQSRKLLQALASDINTRMASVIGQPAPVVAKRAGAAPPPAPAPRPVLPPGELTMTQAMNDILAANGYAKVIKPAPNK